MMEFRHVVLSGCSGGGKSTLLAELERRGFAVVSEPGRRIVREELRGDGAALPWVDLSAFANRVVKLAVDDRKRMTDKTGWVFFDRGLIDAVVALQHATGQPANDILDRFDRYHQKVFMTPPWPEIYVIDNERRHNLSEAIGEYDRLLIVYRELGYETLVLPKVGIHERADFVMHHLG